MVPMTYSSAERDRQYLARQEASPRVFREHFHLGSKLKP